MGLQHYVYTCGSAAKNIVAFLLSVNIQTLAHIMDAWKDWLCNIDICMLNIIFLLIILWLIVYIFVLILSINFVFTVPALSYYSEPFTDALHFVKDHLLTLYRSALVKGTLMYI